MARPTPINPSPASCLPLRQRRHALPRCNPSSQDEPPRLPKGFEPDKIKKALAPLQGFVSGLECRATSRNAFASFHRSFVHGLEIRSYAPRE